jgi:transposase-like protein
MGIRKGGKLRQYTDAAKAMALALYAEKRNIKHVAIALDIPASNIRVWTAGKFINRDVLLKADQLKVEFAETLDDLVQAVAGQMKEKIPDANLLQAASTMKICIEAARLIREQPTPDAAALAGKTPEEIAKIRLAALAKLTLAAKGTVADDAGADE